MDLYQLLRIRKFTGVKSDIYKKENWLCDPETKFFLKASTAPFGKVDLKSVSDLAGCKLNAQLIRQFVTTWGKSHLSQIIRDSENAALQHSDKVLHHYQLNKQLRPQTFVQNYAKEENLLPQRVGEIIDNATDSVRDLLEKYENDNIEERKKYLIGQKNAEKKRKSLLKPLGRNNHVKAMTRDAIQEILRKDLPTGTDIPSFVKGMKPSLWKNFIVRKTHSPDEETGEEMRKLWRDIYAGDLKFGVRDQRWNALKKGIKFSSKSRNAFIARALKSSLESLSKSVI